MSALASRLLVWRVGLLRRELLVSLRPSMLLGGLLRLALRASLLCS
jgi:hypothetical protein